MFQSNAFQNDVTGTIKAFQVSAAPPEEICLLQLEDGSGNLELEDGSGALQLEQCPPEPAPPTGGGAGFVHTFTRRRWRELQLAIEAEQRAEMDLRGGRKPKQQEAIQAAIAAANKAILAALDEAETARLNHELVQMAHALDAAMGATRVTASIKAANRVVALSQAIVAATRAEEDELMQVFLLTLQ